MSDPNERQLEHGDDLPPPTSQWEEKRRERAAKAAADDAAAEEWRAFPELPWTHLSWRRDKGRPRALVSRDGTVWATVRPPVTSTRSWVGVGGTTYSINRIWEDRRGPVRGRLFPRTERVDGRRVLVPKFSVEDKRGTTVLSWRGHHFNQHAGTVLTLADGRTYRFPVRGRFKGAVMSAIEDGGDAGPVVCYRLLSGRPLLSTISTYGQDYSVEVAVGPGATSIPDIQLFVAVTSHHLRRYFQMPGGGG